MAIDTTRPVSAQQERVVVCRFTEAEASAVLSAMPAARRASMRAGNPIMAELYSDARQIIVLAQTVAAFHDGSDPAEEV